MHQRRMCNWADLQGRNGAAQDGNYIYTHKTFHEYCAAFYWSSLACSKKAFNTYLQQINMSNTSDMEYLLRFCCGHSTKAASEILNYVIKLEYTSEYDHDAGLPCHLLFILLDEAVSRYQTELGHQFFEEFKTLAVNNFVKDLDIGGLHYAYGVYKLQCKLSSLVVLLAHLPSVENIKLTHVDISHRLNNLHKSAKV